MDDPMIRLAERYGVWDCAFCKRVNYGDVEECPECGNSVGRSVILHTLTLAVQERWPMCPPDCVMLYDELVALPVVEEGPFGYCRYVNSDGFAVWTSKVIEATRPVPHINVEVVKQLPDGQQDYCAGDAIGMCGVYDVGPDNFARTAYESVSERLNSVWTCVCGCRASRLMPVCRCGMHADQVEAIDELLHAAELACHRAVAKGRDYVKVQRLRTGELRFSIAKYDGINASYRFEMTPQEWAVNVVYRAVELSLVDELDQDVLDRYFDLKEMRNGRE